MKYYVSDAVRDFLIAKFGQEWVDANCITMKQLRKEKRK